MSLYTGVSLLKRLTRNHLSNQLFHAHTSQLSAIHNFCFRPNTPLNDVYDTEVTLHKCNLAYLHVWLLRSHLQRTTTSWA